MAFDPPFTGTSVHRQKRDRGLVSGVFWTALAKWGTQGISWLALLLLSKLLSPEDFGIVSLTVILIGFITYLSECGIDGAIIMATNLTPMKIRQMHTVSVILGFIALALSTLAAPVMAAFFHTPELRLVVPIMGLSFIVTGFRIVPYALLARDMRFKSISLIDAGHVITQALTSLLLARLHYRYWALVWSVVAGFSVSSLSYFILRPCRLARLNLALVRDELHFSWRLLAARLSWFSYSNADFVVAGHMLGTASLGVYTMAWNLASVPIEKISALISRVSPSVLAQVQGDPPEMRRYIRGITETLSIVTFPLVVGLALVAGPLMKTAFNPVWWPAAPALRLLAVCAAVRSISVLCQPVLSAVGEVGFTVKVSLMITFVLPLSFIYASRWEGTGIAAAWLIVFPVLSLPLFIRMLTKTGLPVRQYLASLRPAGVGCAIMVLGVLPLALLHFSSPWKLLGLEVATGAVCYLGTLVLFFRHRLMAVMNIALQRQNTVPE